MEWASAGILKVIPADGPSFFVRVGDIGDSLAAKLTEGPFPAELDPDEGLALLGAAGSYAAERDAMAYLARSEHTRYQLAVKLGRKGHERPQCDRALDRLEAAGALSDSRFARQWVESRGRRKSEGRSKILAGLLERGVARDTAREAIEEFFREQSERELCMRAAERFRRAGRSGDALVRSLLRRGFPLSLVRGCVESTED